MIEIPATLNVQFEALLVKHKIPQRFHSHYSKWLRYYLDFCQKYQVSESNPQSLPDFIRKLKEKRQTDAQQKQANEAIHIYYELIRSRHSDNTNELPKHSPQPEGVSEAQNSNRVAPLQSKLQIDTSKGDSSQNKAAQTEVKGSWQAAYKQLSNEIKVRHYSSKTLKSYSIWVRKFHHFTQYSKR